MSKKDVHIKINNFTFYYANRETPNLIDINMPMYKNSVTAIIGTSGSGKTTLLRSINRIHDITPGNRYEGEIIFNDRNILSPKEDLISLRSSIGMIFQKPTMFPMNILDNITYGLKLKGITNKAELEDRAEEALKNAALFDEVSDRMSDFGDSLSGGQQQRLCIARAIAVEPEIILFDEATSALDPLSAKSIEELIVNLSENITCIVVTHNMQQAGRISDYTAFMHKSKLVEFDSTSKLFMNPKEKLTERYIRGRKL